MDEKEKFNVVGKPEDEPYAQDYLRGARDEGKERISGELLPWTKEEVLFINDVIPAFLEEEAKSLGIVDIPKIDPRQFHFFDRKTFSRKFKQNYHAHIQSNGEIDIVRYRNLFVNFRNMLHEAIHAASYSKFVDISHIRSGYGNNSPKLDPGFSPHQHFAFFNELVTDKIAEEIIEKNLEFLRKKFDFTQAEEDASKDLGYPTQYLDFILEILAQKSGQSVEDIWQRIKQGYFTGEMHYLARLVDKNLGRGSLRFIAAFDPRDQLAEEDIQEIKEFIESDDPKRRDEIAYHLLSEREHLRYKQQAQKNQE